MVVVPMQQAITVVLKDDVISISQVREGEQHTVHLSPDNVHLLVEGLHQVWEKSIDS